MNVPPPEPKQKPLPKISPLVLAFFRRIVQGYFRRSFHAVRLSREDRFPTDTGPLIVYANHSSWWDPMVSVLLARTFLPHRKHYAPMDAQALDRYAIFKHLGIFPVAMNTPRGAAQFLRTGEAILRSGGVLWVTPQGRFVDARSRPLDFKPGLAALVRRVAEHHGSCTVLPLAIEYPFWDERLPETLLRLGQPIHVAGSTATTEAIQTELAQALEQTMDELKHLAFLRDATAFHTIVSGRAGTGGFYALGQRLKALVQRKPYQPEHTVIVAATAAAHPTQAGK